MSTLALPTEIWIRVLESLRTENVELWMSMRHVSRGFKDAVETIFRDKHLPKTFIDIELGAYEAEEGQLTQLTADFKLSRLSEDHNTAIFVTECTDDLKPQVCERLRAYAARTEFETPCHSVQIRREFNDTPIPGISINYDALELSFDWRGLYTQFYVEEKCYEKLTEDWAASKEQWTIDLQAKMFRGELDMQQVMMQAIEEFAGGSDENKEVARRARIRRQYKSVGEEWSFEKDGNEAEEKAARDRMTTAGNVVYLQEFSDDEEGGSEEEDEGDDDDDDEEEEDSWEDTDGEEGEDAGSHDGSPDNEVPILVAAQRSEPTSSSELAGDLV